MVVLTRSLAPILRTTRLATRQQKGINPLQQVFAGDANGVRGLATVFERSKPHVNIGEMTHTHYIGSIGLICEGTIGHVDHGKVRSTQQSSGFLLY